MILAAIGTTKCRPGKTWKTATLLYFDTVCEVTLYGTETEFNAAKKEIDRIFTKIETLFSPTSEPASQPEVRQLYERAEEIFLSSDGCFDITVAPLSEIWGFISKEFRVPEQSEIDSALTLVGMQKTRLGSGGPILLPGMKLDWGGIAKGYGIDEASKSLRDSGISSGFVNAGGDLFCWGMNPDGSPWKIGIKHPRDQGYLGVLSLSDTAAATTGDYQRFFEKDGERYHHVFDPKTGYPARGKQSVTVIGPETLICDALSTALFVAENPEIILAKYPEYGAVIRGDDGGTKVLGKPYAFSRR